MRITDGMKLREKYRGNVAYVLAATWDRDRRRSHLRQEVSGRETYPLKTTVAWKYEVVEETAKRTPDVPSHADLVMLAVAATEGGDYERAAQLLACAHELRCGER